MHFNTLIVAVIGIFGNVISTVSIDWFSRRRYLAFSLVVTAILTGVCGAWTNNIYLLIVATVVNFISQIPWAVLYTYTPEVYPTTCRTTGAGVCSTFNRIGGTITPLIGQVMLSAGHFIPFLTYGLVLGLSAFCSLLLPYETCGKVLTDHVGERKTVPVEGLLPETNDDATEPLIANVEEAQAEQTQV
jgi:MFS family permease